MDDETLLLDSLYENGDLSVDQHAGIMRGFQALRLDLDQTRAALVQARQSAAAANAAAQAHARELEALRSTALAY